MARANGPPLLKLKDKLVRVTIRRERDPWVTGALKITAVRRRAARALAKVSKRLGPGGATVVCDTGDQTVRAAIRPAVLLRFRKPTLTFCSREITI